MEEGDMVKEEEIGVKEGEEEEEDYSKDLQQQSKALDKLTDRHPDGDDQRQLDSTRVQEAMASIAASKQADLNAMRLSYKENPAEVDIIANELELDKKVADDTELYLDKLPPLSAAHPWFVTQNPTDLTHQTFSTLNDCLPQIQCRIPEFSGKLIRGCFHSWIILSNVEKDIWSLWKPLSTSHIISLPPLHLSDGCNHSIRECCLSAPADDASSILLLTRSDKSTFVFCQVSHKRKRYKNRPRWTEMSYANQLERISLNGCYIHSLTCCVGNIYALCRDGDFDSQAVVQFEILFGKTEVIIKLLSFGTTPSIWDTQYDSLVGSAKALFYICVRFCQVRVYHDVPSHVFMFKHDMTSYFNTDHAVLGGVDQRKTELRNLWEQVKDFDEGMFVVDLRVMKTGITGQSCN